MVQQGAALWHKWLLWHPKRLRQDQQWSHLMSVETSCRIIHTYSTHTEYAHTHIHKHTHNTHKCEHTHTHTHTHKHTQIWTHTHIPILMEDLDSIIRHTHTYDPSNIKESREPISLLPTQTGYCKQGETRTYSSCCHSNSIIILPFITNTMQECISKSHCHQQWQPYPGPWLPAHKMRLSFPTAASQKSL